MITVERYYSFRAQIVVIRPKAFCFDDGEHDDFWVPRALCKLDGVPGLRANVNEGQMVKVQLREEMAVEKKLMDPPEPAAL